MKKLLIAVGLLAVFLPASAAKSVNEEAFGTLCQWAQSRNMAANEGVITACKKLGVDLSAKPAGAASWGETAQERLVRLAWEARAIANEKKATYEDARAASDLLKREMEDLNAVRNGQTEERLAQIAEEKAKYEKTMESVYQDIIKWAKASDDYKNYQKLEKNLAAIDAKLENATGAEREKLLQEKAKVEQEMAKVKANINKAIEEARKKDPGTYQSMQNKIADYQRRADMCDSRTTYINTVSDYNESQIAQEQKRLEQEAKDATAAAKIAQKDYNEAAAYADKMAKEAGIDTSYGEYDPSGKADYEKHMK